MRFFSLLMFVAAFMCGNASYSPLKATTQESPSQEAHLTTKESSPFFLHTDDLLSIAALTNADLQDSPFLKDLQANQAVIAISDFNSLSEYPIDIEFLARAVLKDILASKTLRLSNAISGNALQSDKMLDSIRAMRNNSEFGDIIPKGSLLPPKYSLSARISSQAKALSSINSVEYSFIFSIVNLQNGLVEWDYIERIKKSAKAPLPNFRDAKITQSKYGQACLKSPQSKKISLSTKESCEVAIIEIWQNSFASIPANKAMLLYEYAKTGCALKSAFACRALGVAYKYGIKENLNTIAEFSGKDYGLALDEKEHILLQVDFAKAKSAYSKSCDLRDGGGCYNLALMQYHSENQDLQKASEYASKGCKYGFSDGCELEKEIEQAKSENLEPEALTKIAQCEENIPQSCVSVAFNYHHGLQGAVKNQTKASQYYKKACDLGYSHSCYILGMYQVQGYGQGAKDMREALKNVLKACNADPVRECEAINKLDPTKRTQQQCVTQGKLVAGSACLSAGGFFESGVGVKMDTNEALRTYKRGCDFGVDMACEAYKNLKERVR
ncbi:hypothetical protein [Helicobacter sp. 23-1046]